MYRRTDPVEIAIARALDDLGVAHAEEGPDGFP